MHNSLSAQSMPNSFLNQIEEVGEMVLRVYRSLAVFVKKLGSLDMRISNYQNQSGYNWVDYGAQLSIKSDFYGYIKINQKNMDAELGELYYNLEVCKQRFNSVMLNLNKSNAMCSGQINQLVLTENIINFPKKKSLDDKDAAKDISDLLSKTEKIVRAVEQKHKQLISRTENLILQMRGQFDK